MSIPKRKTIKALNTKKGAKGTSVFMPIFFLEKNTNSKLTIEPIQKDRMRIAKDWRGGKIQARARINFASPSPIHLPLPMSQIKAKGSANNGPAINLIIVGVVNIDEPPV